MKDECAANEYVQGVAETTSGYLDGILCCPGTIPVPGHYRCGAVQVSYAQTSPSFDPPEPRCELCTWFLRSGREPAAWRCRAPNTLLQHQLIPRPRDIACRNTTGCICVPSASLARAICNPDPGPAQGQAPAVGSSTQVELVASQLPVRQLGSNALQKLPTSGRAKQRPEVGCKPRRDADARRVGAGTTDADKRPADRGGGVAIIRRAVAVLRVERGLAGTARGAQPLAGAARGLAVESAGTGARAGARPPDGDPLLAGLAAGGRVGETDASGGAEFVAERAIATKRHDDHRRRLAGSGAALPRGAAARGQAGAASGALLSEETGVADSDGPREDPTAGRDQLDRAEGAAIARRQTVDRVDAGSGRGAVVIDLSGGDVLGEGVVEVRLRLL